MSELIEYVSVYLSGVITIPVLKYLVIPYAKKKLKQKWNNEDGDEMSDKKRGRPKGSKNKPKEEEK